MVPPREPRMGCTSLRLSVVAFGFHMRRLGESLAYATVGLALAAATVDEATPLATEAADVPAATPLEEKKTEA